MQIGGEALDDWKGGSYALILLRGTYQVDRYDWHSLLREVGLPRQAGPEESGQVDELGGSVTSASLNQHRLIELTKRQHTITTPSLSRGGGDFFEDFCRGKKRPHALPNPQRVGHPSEPLGCATGR